MHADDRAARASPRAPATIVGAAFLLGAVPTLAGCAVGPDFATPETTGPGELARRRRRAHHDADRGRQPVVEGVQRSGARSTGRPRPPAEPAAAGRRPADRRGARAVRRRHRPAVSPDAGGVRQRRGGRAHRAGRPLHRAPLATCSPIRLGFDAAWELDFWGKYRRGVEAEGANLLASVADYQAALVSLTAEVARTYVAIRTAEVLIKQAQDNARVQEEALGIAKSRFQAGATSELDPTQATTLLESTRASVPRFEIQLAAGAKRPEHAARSAGGGGRAAADRAQGDSEAAREGGGRRAGRDAAAPSGHPQRRDVGRRAVRPHRRRQGGALSELLADRHDRPAGAEHGDGVPQPVLHQQRLLFRRPQHQLGRSSTTAA